MLAELDPIGQLVAMLLLLILSLVTVEYCRRDSRSVFNNESAFLFRGKTALYSLASNAGSVFSLTYFFGGVLIYGYYFGLWYLLLAALILLSALLLLWRMIAKIAYSAANKELESNLLLDYLKAHLTPSDFVVMVRLYSIVYFLLLVEELAVGRLALTMLLPSHPAVSALALGLICTVVITYLSLGGFRAILNSDLVQMTVIGGFLLALIFLMAKSHGLPNQLILPTRRRGVLLIVSAFPMALIFGVSWFVASVDFFSRLNFMPSRIVGNVRQKQLFAVVSLVCIFIVITIGIFYGMQLRSILPAVQSPSLYTEAMIAHFLGLGRPVISAIFVVSIFCMLFTTVDTLLLTVVQVDSYRLSPTIGKTRIAIAMLVAVGLSCLIDFDAVSAFGIFAGSLMILPAIGVAKGLSNWCRRLAPPSLVALEWALLAAGVVFALVFSTIKTNFTRHYMLPGIVVGAAVLATLVGHIRQWIKT